MQIYVHTYHKHIWWNIQSIPLIAGQKWSHPCGDDHTQITKKTIYNNRDTKDLKKRGCVCTCCHRNNLPQYDCIIFLKQKYNFNIPTVANALSKWYREIRQK